MNTLIYRLQSHRLVRILSLFLLSACFAYVIGRLALDAGKLRWLLGISIIFVIYAISQRRPVLAIYLLMLYIPFMGLIRRLLIPVAGWNSLDPLVIIQPAIVLILGFNWAYRTYIARVPIRDDTVLFRLVRWLLLVDIIQIVNPLQGSLLTGLAGSIYFIVPVLFMVLGREYLNETGVKRLLLTVLVIGVLVALYGYKQFLFGWFPFEETWIRVAGYTALRVYSEIRPVSVFNSGAEYAHYIGLATVIGWVYVLYARARAKLIPLLAVVFLYVNLFIESARGVIVTVTLALAVVTIARARTKWTKVLTLLMVCLSFVALYYGMLNLNTDSDLIYHSVRGLTDPLAEDSTFLGHVRLMVDGFLTGFTNPLGYGLGITSMAAIKFSGKAIGSEVDLSNQFIATGLAGGILYLLIVWKALAKAWKLAKEGSPVFLTIFGILVAEIGQWLTGGHYAVVPIVWMMIGFLDRTIGIRERKRNLENSLDRANA